MSSASINRTLGAALLAEQIRCNTRSKRDPNISAAAQWSTVPKTACTGLLSLWCTGVSSSALQST